MRKVLKRVPKLGRIPRTTETAFDLAKAARDIGLRRFVSDSVRKERRSICEACPSWDAQRNQCIECGCQMKVKTTLTSSKCPLNKWGPQLK